MKLKEIVAAIMMSVGMVLAIGTVGTLDFLGATATEAEMNREIVKAIIAGGLMIASQLIVIADSSNNKE